MTKTPTTFDVELVKDTGDVAAEYHGQDPVAALGTYTQCFRDFLTQPHMECIVSRIDGKNTQHFKELIEDFYL